MSDSQVELQTRLTFLEDTVATLNDVVAAHEQTIERLERVLGTCASSWRLWLVV